MHKDLSRVCAKNGIAGFGTSFFNHYRLTFQSSWIRLQPFYPLVVVCGKYMTQWSTQVHDHFLRSKANL